MIDIKTIREQAELVKQSLRKRNENDDVVDVILEFDKQRRKIIEAVNALRGQRNAASRKVAQLKASGENEEAEKVIAQAKQLGQQIATEEKKLSEYEEKIMELLLRIPNICHESVPFGNSEDDNVEVRKWGKPRVFDFEPQAHWDLGPKLKLMDFERAAKLSGSRFTVMYSCFARLERALINFMLDI
ncbi:MAG: serine--tRNA ligase, partial [Thermotogae bacterium]